LDIMSAAVVELRGEDLAASKQLAGVNATAEQQRETAGRLHEDESRATRGPPSPAIWTAVSVTPLDRGVGSGQKSPSAAVPLMENSGFPKPTYEYLEAEPRHHTRHDAVRRVTSGGGVVARKVVSGWS
jgi:hypothetical protein